MHNLFFVYIFLKNNEKSGKKISKFKKTLLFYSGQNKNDKDEIHFFEIIKPKIHFKINILHES